MKKKKIAFIVGTRPEIIKVFPVYRYLKSNYKDYFIPILINTGQHKEMAEQMLKIFKMKPDFSLNIMSSKQTISQIVERSLRGLDKVYDLVCPSLVMVQGDTSTAFSGALGAYHRKIPVAHIEAGLRSYDKYNPHPEEINRKMIDCFCDIHFPPTKDARKNLISENVNKNNIFVTGNTIIDAVNMIKKISLKDINLSYVFSKEIISLKEIKNQFKKFILVEVHRRESWERGIINVCNAIKVISETYNDVSFVFTVHKNPVIRGNIKFLGSRKNIFLIEPVDYISFIHLMESCHFIITDSGGIQEEAPTLKKPVLVVREKTERPEVIKTAAAKLVGTDERVIIKYANYLLTDYSFYKKMSNTLNPYGDGNSSKRICEALMYYFNFIQSRPSEF